MKTIIKFPVYIVLRVVALLTIALKQNRNSNTKQEIRLFIKIFEHDAHVKGRPNEANNEPKRFHSTCYVGHFCLYIAAHWKKRVRQRQ